MKEQAARTLRPEDEISHYRIVGPLGAGGMGEVYLAEDRTLERKVALKVLPPDLVRSEERVRRFVLEAKSASSLSHPNIVTIYEIGQDPVRTAGEPDSGPVHYISMELVSGKSLSTLIHEDKTDLRTLLGYLAQAAEGLAKAHAAGIVHRDLKPGNVMVSADGYTKVLDFGLAKLTEKRGTDGADPAGPTMLGDATSEGIVVGTVGYMSPEQVQGKPVDHRADIFSFGCILYEAATRRRPFAAETGVETMHKILNEKPVPVEEHNDRVPAELRRLIRRCLAKNPDQRLQSMKDLAIELREIADEYDSLSASASSGSLASVAVPALAPRRASPFVWIGGALAVVAALAVAWWALRRDAGGPAPYQTVRMTTLTNRGDVTEAALSPDGRFLAYLAGRGGRVGLRVRQVATGSDVEVIQPQDPAIQFPSFTPDGNYLLYTAAQRDKEGYRALYQVPALGGTSREIAFDVDSRVSFSPDGKRFVFWRHVSTPLEERLVIFDPQTAQERLLATFGSGTTFLGSPAWSPDGKRIAALILESEGGELRSTIVLFDVESGRRQELTRMDRTILRGLCWLGDGSAVVSNGQDLRAAISDQVFLHSVPGGRTTRVTNDFHFYSHVSASVAEEAVAAVRNTQVRNVWIAPTDGGSLRKLTSLSNPETSLFGTTIADSLTLAFCAPDRDYLQIWAVSAAGGEPRRLTSDEAHSFRPLSAESGVVYDRLDSAGVHLWRVNPDGSGRRQLTRGAGEQATAVSADGRFVVHGHYESRESLSVISTADGRAVLRLGRVRGALGFSPDSRSIAVSFPEQSEQGLTRSVFRVLPLDGSPSIAEVRFPNASAGMRWAPDGRSFTYRNQADPNWNVYRQPLDGGPPTPITRLTEGRITDHQWSRDGRRLAARVQSGDVANVWIFEADGSRPAPLTNFTSETVFLFGWMRDNRSLFVEAGTTASDVVLFRELR